MNYIKLTNFGNENIDRIASYMIMENDYVRKDIIHNAVYNMDRYGYVNSKILQLCIENAVKDAGENPDTYIDQKLIDDVIKEYNRG